MPHSSSSQSLYQRLVERLLSGFESAEQAVQHDLDQAIEMETAAEEMTREEAALLAAYLKRDLQSLNRFVRQSGKGLADWLRFDIDLLEDRLLSLLLSVARETDLPWPAGAQETVYHAGEYVLAGTLRCESCGHHAEILAPQQLAPCAECGAEQFTRMVGS